MTETAAGWFFEGKPLEDDQIPENAIAFLYMITHIESGRWYIGRKNLYRKVTKNVKSKSGVVKKKRSQVESDWRDYWSSSDYLKEFVAEEGKDKFKREIMIFVETASATIYGEEALLYMTGSMFDPLCFNGHIRTKIMKKWFEKKESDLHNRLKKCLQHFERIQMENSKTQTEVSPDGTSYTATTWVDDGSSWTDEEAAANIETISVEE